jgi:hypothetical protein
LTPETNSEKVQDLADNNSNNGKSLYERLIEVRGTVGMLLLSVAREASTLERRADQENESLVLQKELARLETLLLGRVGADLELTYA